jgi:hypothetical protein
MEFEDALFGWARGQAEITSLIGAPPGVTRFYHLKNPQGTKFPSLVQQRDGTSTQQLYCGPDGAVRVSLRIDAYGKTRIEMAAAAKAFRVSIAAALANGPIMMGDGDSPLDAVKVKAAFMDNQVDLDDPSPGLFRRSQLWSFWIFEP